MTAEPAAPALAAQVARLFFERQLSKVEIAARLGISRFRVARLIDQALADGLVRIEFRDVPAQHRELARRVEERWGLDLCVVAADAPEQPATPPLARLAALTLPDLVHPGDTVGVGSGAALAAVVRAVAPRSDPTVSVVQLVGGSSRIEPEHSAGEVARRLAETLDAACHPLHAPASVESSALRDALLREPEIGATAQRFEDLSLALVGVGVIAADRGPTHPATVESSALAPADARAASARGAVGDLVLHAFDAAGRFVAPELSARMIGITPDQLRRVPRVVAVAGGAGAVTAICGALATGIVTVLITDQAAAELIAAAERINGAEQIAAAEPAGGAAPGARATARDSREPGAANRSSGSATEAGSAPGGGPRRPAPEWRW